MWENIKTNENKKLAEIEGSRKYFSENPLLDNSIACKIGFQLKNGFNHSGIFCKEKKTPLIKYRGLIIMGKISWRTGYLKPAIINIKPNPKDNNEIHK